MGGDQPFDTVGPIGRCPGHTLSQHTDQRIDIGAVGDFIAGEPLWRRMPRRISSAVGMVLELLAGIPSVVVGLWGAMTFGPFIAHHIAPIIADTLGKIPGLTGFFGGDTGNGQGLLTSGLILAVMVIPIIAAT